MPGEREGEGGGERDGGGIEVGKRERGERRGEGGMEGGREKE